MLLTRVITASLLAIGVILVLFNGNTLAWLALLLLTSIIASWEWSGFARVKSKFSKATFSASLFLLFYGFYLYLPDQVVFLLTPISFLLMLFMVIFFQRSQGKSLIKNDLLILIMGLLVMLPFFVSMMLFRDVFSPSLILFSLMIVWAVDVGAYFAGRRFGKTKLALYVSPGKTWEGVFGGVLLAFLVSYIGLSGLSPIISLPYWQAAIVLSLIGALSIFGDLFESLLKRQVGLKDSGKLLPGHGGLLDRIDSVIIAMPIFYLFWLWAS